MKSPIRYCSFFGIFLVLVVAAASAQPGRIEGQVTDEAGNPVAFANVLIEGTTIGAAASANGRYTIRIVPAGTHTLVATAVGFRRKTAEITIREGQTLTQNFTLAEDVLGMREVVVTGTFTPQQKLESTVSISTLGPEELEISKPRSTTEMLRYVPGFTRVESSGGEVNQNISIRGILGVEYVMFMEDGMPVFPTMHTFFMNADNLFRADENIAEVEVVRGGSSALFGSNTPGAIINFMNKVGGPQIAGSVRGQVATEGLARYDFNVNGPLAEDWRFNFGGFYRYDHGVRDPGYPGIRGGQVKGSITRLLENGYVRVSTKLIDDRNQFILPLPFQNPDDPEYVPGFSDFGSMSTNEGNHIRVPIPTGELELPLDNGLRTDAQWLTGDVAFSFEDDWSVQNTAQIMRNAQEWNAIVPFDVLRAGDYIRGLGLPAGSSARLLYTNHFDATGRNIPVDTNALLAPGGEWHVEKPISHFQNQMQVKKAFGPHNLSLGIYFANYTQKNRWFFTEILTDVRDNPRFVDVQVISPLDTTMLTKSGFRRFLSLYVNGDGQTTIFSGTLGASLELTDRLRVDLGVRYEFDDYVQTAENTSPIDLDGDPATVYDNVPWGNTTFRHFNRSLDDYAISGGANYRLTDEVAVYAQASRAYKMPALDEFLNAQAQDQIELFENQNTLFFEGGVKYSSERIGGTATGFWGELRNILGQGAEVDPGTGVIRWVTRRSPDSRSWGGEVDVQVSPITGLRLRGAGTFVKPQTVEAAGAALTASNTPSVLLNFSAHHTVREIGLSFLADWHFVGNRELFAFDRYDFDRGVFVNYRKVGELMAYNYMNLGVGYTIPGQGVTLSADLLNVYQSKGLEEGNPRLPGEGGFLFLARPILPRRFQVTARYQF